MCGGEMMGYYQITEEGKIQECISFITVACQFFLSLNLNTAALCHESKEHAQFLLKRGQKSAL
jgi:hypothetical protein